MAETKKTTTTKATSTKTTTTKKAAPKKVSEAKAPVEAKETVKVAEVAKKPAKKAVKEVKVTLVKSPIGYDKKQARVAKALGLKKLNSSNILPDNACVRGMVKKINHLVKLEELN